MSDLVSVVILNYNGRKFIEACVGSVLAQDYPDMEIIVVDNGSSDGSSDVIRERYPQVRLIETGRNLGFAAGNNVGIRWAKGEYIVILNNDAELEQTCITEMKRAIDKDPAYGACASKIYLKFEQNLLDAAGIVVCPDGLSIGRGRLESGDSYNEEVEVFFGSGCCIMCRRTMLEDVRVGGYYFDEDFFMYADDTDLGWRARLRGWKCIYTPDARVYHAHSAASGSYSHLKAFHVERNRIWIPVKYFPLILILYGQFFTVARYLFQAYGAFSGKGASGAFTKEHSRGDLMGVLFKVYWSALKGLPRMWKKRREIQKRREITTRDMFNLLRRYGIRTKDIGLKG
ncbi:glycosyltransferase family 2 protein [Syntrophorhabdus aromaticivorans]|uniref:Glycosyltransferase family 2 protein n=1 Tax=Syntrophorhabdus aromaticivorans TaxID=328301 RepID=A0A351U2H1_9BACT|nr:glycosyltransferase family 2 protein [Syntrophorhabdus aromaticivorans]NLW34884.1 glycosyltransferase family 2 protein [Syntrophorhabdus aromaticivorans]HBA54152.1 glycosyltransferase family 2 protein [Syntrophorhabdus aromaticivorans]